MSESAGDVRLLIEQVAQLLVDTPDEVLVHQVDEDGETVLELDVAPEDVGKLIGRHGRTARALRCLLAAAGTKTHKRLALEILE
ncbi:MAG TPA: KH domain-containing protein [Terriglobales bacterium]|nr:KH domain-containing protein [Terriglobales bacterium]